MGITALGAKQLIFSLRRLTSHQHKSLRNIPMSVLYDGKHYLVEHYSLVLAPGLQVVNPKLLHRQSLKAFAAGISEARPPNFAKLPNVPKELQSIQAEVPSQVLLNQQFTTQALQSQLMSRSFPIVHLATHGEFSSSPEGTFILVWDQLIKVNDLNTLLRGRAQNNPDPMLKPCDRPNSLFCTIPFPIFGHLTFWLETGCKREAFGYQSWQLSENLLPNALPYQIPDLFYSHSLTGSQCLYPGKIFIINGWYRLLIVGDR